MKKLWRTLLLTPFVVSMNACAYDWPSFHLENEEKYEFHSNVQYGGYIKMFVDVCYPKEIQAPGLIMFIHGDTWNDGDKSSYKEEMIEYSTKYGLITASMNYHYVTKGEFDAYTELKDIKEALDKVVSYSEERDIEIKKAILSGSGSGGHLAALYASRCIGQNTVPIAATWLDSPVTSLYSDAFIKQNAVEEKKMIKLMSELTGVNKNSIKEMEHELKDLSPIDWIIDRTPRTLICIGAKDNIAPYVDNVKYIEELERRGIECDSLIFENSGHDLANDADKAQLEEQLKAQYIDDLFY